MKLDPTTAYLLDLGPHPGDEALRAFADIEPPQELCEATLAAVFDEETIVEDAVPEAANNRRWYKFVVAGLGAVATVLLVVHASPETGDVSSMKARGLDHSTPSVALKMATRQDGKLDRFHTGQRYGPGDVLYFRYQTDGDAWMHLVHADHHGVQVIDQRKVQAGEADLSLDGSPLAWTLEKGDQSCVFALITSNEPIDPELLQQALAGSGKIEDADTLCMAAARAGLHCDGVRVEVKR